MPNWVYNTIEYRGKEADVKRFDRLASKPYATAYEDHFSDKIVHENHTGFSFWNFIAPPADKLDLYFETNGSKPDGNGGMIRTGNTEWNWYNWNINNWDTKWDASNADTHATYIKGENASQMVTFDTAWSPPQRVFEAMVEQFPELTFDFRWEEEQGWGGKAIGHNGVFSITDEWDIPNSHEEWIAMGSDCRECEWGSEDRYSDCPVDEEELANA